MIPETVRLDVSPRQLGRALAQLEQATERHPDDPELARALVDLRRELYGADLPGAR